MTRRTTAHGAPRGSTIGAPGGSARETAAVLSRPSSGARREAGAWLRALNAHTERLRREYPGDELLILFDVDGTLLDLRWGLLDLLHGYDRERGSELFAGLSTDDLVPDEAGVRRLFEQLDVPHVARQELLVRFERMSWSPRAVIGSHQPFLGMLELLRWFKHQPRVHVAVNTSRSEDRRDETVQALSALGAHYGLRLTEDFLFLDPEPPRVGEDRTERGVRSKIGGVHHFRSQGFRVAAVVDDRQEVLEGIGRAFADPDLLLVQAEGLAASLPVSATKSGGSREPARVVWRGLESVEGLGHFLGSSVGWAEIALERGPSGAVLVSRRERRADRRDSRAVSLELEELLGAFAQCNKGMRIVFREGGSLVRRALHRLRASSFPAHLVSFCAAPERIGESGFREVREAFPAASRLAAVEFLSGLAEVSPDLSEQQFARLSGWGVTRVSIEWTDPRREVLCRQARDAGLEVDIDARSDLAHYLEAVSDLPCSVVSDFGCRRWLRGE